MSLPLLSLPKARCVLDTRFPHLLQRDPKSCPIGSIALGRTDTQPVTLARRARFEHTHVIGTTGGGKTNALEVIIKQDIKNGDGVFVIDPHGSHPASMYRSLITWLFSRGYHKS